MGAWYDRAMGEPSTSSETSLVPSLARHQELIITQRTELAEVALGIETRNKYAICTDLGQPVAYAAEQGKGALDFLVRLVLKHWRTYEIHLFTADRKLVARAKHPFRWLWFNECLQVRDARGNPLGSIQRRFSIFSKRFDVLGPNGDLLMSVDSGLFRIWTFEFKQGIANKAIVEKRWSGVLKEVFTDADNFRLRFISSELGDGVRWLLIAAAIFVDLQWFEDSGSSSESSSSDD